MRVCVSRDTASCLADAARHTGRENVIVFVGDSRMRELYHAFNYIVFNDPSMPVTYHEDLSREDKHHHLQSVSQHRLTIAFMPC